MTGSSGTLQGGLFEQQHVKPDLKRRKKLGTKSFLSVDTRPNG
jgi:hypothetical protein